MSMNSAKVNQHKDNRFLRGQTITTTYTIVQALKKSIIFFFFDNEGGSHDPSDSRKIRQCTYVQYCKLCGSERRIIR
jgi:hypothetical protein